MIELKRHLLSDTATLGDVYVDGVFVCHSLEDVVRLDDPSTPQDEGEKVWGKTAIPAGVYRVIINMSPKFKKLLPRLLDVPGFDGILIHKGNTAEDTHGCILVGDAFAKDTLKGGSSTPAFDRLFKLIRDARLSGDEVSITITNEFGDRI